MAAQRKPAKTPDLGEIMKAKRKKDAQEKKENASAAAVKGCHLLAKEAVTRLGAARLETSSYDAIVHDLQRTLEIADELKIQVKGALRTLGKPSK